MFKHSFLLPNSEFLRDRGRVGHHSCLLHAFPLPWAEPLVESGNGARAAPVLCLASVGGRAVGRVARPPCGDSHRHGISCAAPEGSGPEPSAGAESGLDATRKPCLFPWLFSGPGPQFTQNGQLRLRHLRTPRSQLRGTQGARGGPPFPATVSPSRRHSHRHGQENP